MSEQERLAFWTKALNLAEFRVVHEHRATPSDPVRFTVVPRQELGVCPDCGHASDSVHRRRDSSPIKDLPLSEQPVDLLFRTPQFHCERCDTFFTPGYGAFAPGAPATERFLAQAAKLIRFSDIANAAAFFGVAENTLTRWYYDYVERQQKAPPANLKPIKSIGIDELSLKKRALRQQYGTQKYDRGRQESLEAATGASGVLVDPRPTPAQAAEAGDEWDRLLRDLPERERRVLEMARAGHTHLEIACRLTLSERTVARILAQIHAPEARRN